MRLDDTSNPDLILHIDRHHILLVVNCITLEAVEPTTWALMIHI